MKLDRGENEEKVDPSQYRRIVGRLLYLQATRPDVIYSVNILSQFVADPRRNHLDALHRVLRYLKGTTGQECSYLKMQPQGSYVPGISLCLVGLLFHGRRRSS